jgi:hypothetical protein
VTNEKSIEYDSDDADELLRLARKGKKFEKLSESNCPWELCTGEPADEDVCNGRCPFGDMCDGFELGEVTPDGR